MKINFKDTVIEKFNYLETEYAYIVKQAGSNLVKYENSSVIITMEYDPPRSEILIYFELNDSTSTNTISINDLDIFYCASLNAYTASNQITIDKCLCKISDFMRNKATDIINGDVFIFKRVLANAIEVNRKYNEDLQMTVIRRNLSKLWDEKRYADIVKLLMPVENKLSPTEIKKLLYSKKNNKNNDNK